MSLLSVIAGMVDVIGYFELGHVFTSHITGNIVVIAAALGQKGRPGLSQVLVVPMFMLAMAVMWMIARKSQKRGANLQNTFLLIQFVLITAVLVLSVVEKPADDPRGLAAGVAVMIAVVAMASQYALFRLATTQTVSTSAMTGNLSNTIIAMMDAISTRTRLVHGPEDRVITAVIPLLGFVFGCVLGAAGLSLFDEWAWALPAAVSGAAYVGSIVTAPRAAIIGVQS
jgi:uncharacterized membrane protein YoaK (UPF0700 family)